MAIPERLPTDNELATPAPAFEPNRHIQVKGQCRRGMVVDELTDGVGILYR